MLKNAGRGILAACLLGLVVACSEGGAAAPTRSKEEAIRELMEVTNADQAGAQALEQMGAIYEAQFGPEFGEFWAEFMSRVDQQELNEMVIPIYAKHFETEEVEELIAFNKTALGQKIAAVMPQIMQESIAVGAEWGQGIAMEALEEYNAGDDR